MVYFVQHGDEKGAIKIGRTNNIRSRLADLQVGTPVELHILGVIDSEQDGEVEKWLHLKFKSSRIRGEWFTPSLELSLYIKGCSTLPSFSPVEQDSELDYKNSEDGERIGTTEIARLRGVTVQAVLNWCSKEWLKTARKENVGRRRLWMVDRKEVLTFEPPKTGVAKLQLDIAALARVARLSREGQSIL